MKASTSIIFVAAAVTVSAKSEPGPWGTKVKNNYWKAPSSALYYVPEATPHRGRAERRQTAPLCGPLGTPQCCEVSVLGVATLSCSPVPNSVTATADFIGFCAKEGKTAQCCTLSLLNSVGLLCTSP